jgi:hypothetical protein
MLKPKKLKVFALILLTSALLLLAVNANVSSVKAASTTSVFVYTILGGTISGNGTSLSGDKSYTYTTGDTVAFTATPSSGFKFLCFEYATSSGAQTSTNNPFSETLSATSCAVEAMFIPTINYTASSTSSGAASVTIFATIGGTTTPAGGVTGPTYSDYTVGTVSTFTQTPGTNFKFLCWVTQTSAGSAVYTASPLSLKIPSSSIAMEALWIPTSSTVTVPTIVNEYSTAVVAILAIALVASALGTYAYTKRNKK